ncbi:hypothetical protein EC973_002550 [Apophysomyces ossiformis]|uniref:F-box domain-containing protein n=1 Tax=Apophysomyces ossiformis TaxID=679940 RepID=A0A8H7BR69_9FUNG|nr:hypothetical protein EC973_002550 [Apophysomyces ossiformis]
MNDTSPKHLANDLSVQTSIHRLPVEILDDVASYISKKSLLVAVCVCRSWNAAFSPLLYKSVEINSSKMCELLLTTLATATTQKHLGHHVRKLDIRYALKRPEISHLVRLCPFLGEIAAITSGADDYIPLLPQWHYLKRISLHLHGQSPLMLPAGFLQKRLTHLVLTIDDFSEWIAGMPLLPAIEDLTIYFRFKWKSGGWIQIDDLERLHEALPHLQSLTLEDVGISGEIPEQVVPCRTLRNLSLKWYSGYLWGQYFSQKYTNLETLTLSKHPLMYTTDVKLEILSLASSCRYLKKLTMNGREDYQFFLSILQTIQAPLTNITSYSHNSNAWFLKAIRSFRQSLSTVYIQERLGTGIADALTALKACSSLVDLRLECYNHDFEIDRMLEGLNRLKHLTVKGNRILVSGSCTNNMYHHLIDLTMRGTNIDKKVYHYLSQHCPRLHSLDCQYSFIAPRAVQQRNCLKQSYSIYYPNPNLKSLNIDCREEVLLALTMAQKSQASEPPRASRGAQWYHGKKNRVGRLNATEVPAVMGEASDEKGVFTAIGCQESKARSNKHPFPIDIPIVYVHCHKVEEIYLNETNLFYIE